VEEKDAVVGGDGGAVGQGGLPLQHLAPGKPQI